MDSKLQAIRATNHFGLGGVADEPKVIAGDPRGWLDAQLDRQQPTLAIDGSEERLRTMFDFADRQKRTRAGQEKADRARFFRDTVRPLVASDLERRLSVAVDTENPLLERLALFWSNHFTVSHAGKRQLAVACAAFENEAIRPNLAGHFRDLLFAAESHPAMLIYLDNHLSVGPNARLPRRRGRGLNENLAREILELHTVGVAGGYGQADVTALAKILTGWTVSAGMMPRRLVPGPAGEFRFVDALHEPGKHVVMGNRYAEDGLSQGRQALADLARHPATARFVATKLVRHFVADDPPAEAVAVIEAVFLRSDGHLPTVHGALVNLDAAWDPGNRKLRTPYEWVVAIGRGLSVPATARRGIGQRFLQMLDHVPFTAPSPAGWADTLAHWGSPGALKTRVELAMRLGERLGNRVDARAAGRHMIAGDELLQAIARAESPGQGLGLLLAAPEFQWRA